MSKYSTQFRRFFFFYGLISLATQRLRAKWCENVPLLLRLSYIYENRSLSLLYASYIFNASYILNAPAWTPKIK